VSLCEAPIRFRLSIALDFAVSNAARADAFHNLETRAGAAAASKSREILTESRAEVGLLAAPAPVVYNRRFRAARDSPLWSRWMIFRRWQ
jgi:hypothetical protein